MRLTFKKLFLTSAVCGIFVGCAVDVNSLSFEDGSYLDDKRSLFSGTVFSFYPDGKINEMYHLTNGKKNGCYVSFSETGNFTSLRTFFDERSGNVVMNFNEGTLLQTFLFSDSGFLLVDRTYDPKSSLVTREIVAGESDSKKVVRHAYPNGMPRGFRIEEGDLIKISMSWYPNGVLAFKEELIQEQQRIVRKTVWWLPDGSKIGREMLDEDWNVIEASYWNEIGGLVEEPLLRIYPSDVEEVFLKFAEGGKRQKNSNRTSQP